jgi:hypothetical protein
MTKTPDPTRPAASAAEADLAFLRGIVERGGNRGQMTMGVIFLAGGLLYGIQCLFHLGQISGLIRVSGLISLIFVIFITASVLAAIVWAVVKDRKTGVSNRSGPAASRAMNGAFSGAGMANLAVIIVFGVGATREHDFSIWLYYAAIVFAFQSVAWYMAWTLKGKAWMGFVAMGHWTTAVALGVLVRQPFAYLCVCTAALFLLFALPGWIIIREARAAKTAA